MPPWRPTALRVPPGVAELAGKIAPLPLQQSAACSNCAAAPMSMPQRRRAAPRPPQTAAHLPEHVASTRRRGRTPLATQLALASPCFNRCSTVPAHALLRERRQLAARSNDAVSTASPATLSPPPSTVIDAAATAPPRGGVRGAGTGTSQLTSPMAHASSAGTGLPAGIRSMARDMPIRRGRRTVPPSMRGTPHRRQKTPNTASDAATRRSAHSASSKPPATQ